MFSVCVDDIEPTRGWSGRYTKGVRICLKHSFGKCFERCVDGVSSCFQIHIKTDVLKMLRRNYTNPVRRYLCERVITYLPKELYYNVPQEIEVTLNRMIFIEFNLPLPNTRGLDKYEKMYRVWLSTYFPTKLHSDKFRVDMRATICPIFATEGKCPNREACEYIHADPKFARIGEVRMRSHFIKTFSKPPPPYTEKKTTIHVDAIAGLDPDVDADTDATQTPPSFLDKCSCTLWDWN